MLVGSQAALQRWKPCPEGWRGRCHARLQLTFLLPASQPLASLQL